MASPTSPLWSLPSPTSPFKPSSPPPHTHTPPWNEELQTNLQKAKDLIDGKLLKDEQYPDLWQVCNHVSRASAEYFQERPKFSQKRIVPLPQTLIEQINHFEVKVFMGLLPQIQRVWVSVDNRLFLWNYEEGGDFCVYDALPQVIVSVAVVPPRPGIFVDNVKHLLIIATPVEIQILALVFSGEGVTGELSLVETGFQIASDNVHMLKIVGTSSGRIFMCGNDGCLYELVYQGEEGWFSSKCRKINRTSGRITQFLPSFLKFAQEDPIIDISIDEKRKLLYTLSDRKSTIQVYHLGFSGTEMNLIISRCNIIAESQRICPRLISSHAMKIEGITAISPDESGPIHLVAITNTGVRFYLTTSTSPGTQLIGSTFQGIPSVLDLVHIRLAPPPGHYPPSPGQAPVHLATETSVHAYYYEMGTILIAETVDEETDKVKALTIDFFASRSPYNYTGQSQFTTQMNEDIVDIQIPGRVWSLSEEVSVKRILEQWKTRSSTINIVIRNELSTQHIVPPRSFLCLTNKALHVIQKSRPLDELAQVLIETVGRESDDLVHFFKKYGEDEACSMCLTLACRSGSSAVYGKFSGSMADSFPAGLDNWAASTFFKLGGRPYISGSSLDGTFTASFTDITYSHAHNGFAMYLARILRPLWNSPVLAKTNVFNMITNKMQSVYVCNYTLQQLQQTSQLLSNLRDFLKQNPQFASIPVNDGQGSLRIKLINRQKRTIDEEASTREQKSLACLHLLLLRALEAAHLLTILSKNKLEEILQSLPEDVLNVGLGIKYRELVIASDGVSFVKALITHVISRYTAAPVENLLTQMRTEAPMFFSDTDRLAMEGHQYLQASKRLSPGVERRSLLEKSLKTFNSIAGQLALGPICGEYTELEFYTGVVKLVLSYTKQIDPQNHALSWHNAMRPAGDNEGKMKFQSRMEAYEYVTNIFTKMFKNGASDSLKLETVQAAIESDDELFHYTIYGWYLDCGLQDELLQLRTTYVENFLKSAISNLDLLWRYYLLNGNFVEGSLILRKLAEKSSFDITLEERIENLARAKTALSRATEKDASSILHDVQEKMEVAKIQLQIYNTLKNEKIPNLEEVLRELHSQLYTISQLFNKFAKKWELWESQLAIIDCSAHQDPVLVRNIWKNIIEKELNKTKNLTALSEKVLEIGKQYFTSELVFPLEFLVDYLERIPFDIVPKPNGYEEDWVLNLMLNIGVSFATLFDVYNHYFESKDPYWHNQARQIHLVQVIYILLKRWIAALKVSTKAWDMNQFTTRKLSVQKYITSLSTNKEAVGLVQNLRQLETEINF